MADDLEDSYLIRGDQVLRTGTHTYHSLTRWARDNQLDSVLVIDSIVPAEQFMPTVMINSPYCVGSKAVTNRTTTFESKWYMPRSSREEVIGKSRVSTLQ